MLMHVSYAFPSEWVPISEALIGSLLAVLCVRRGSLVQRFGDSFWRAADRLPHGRGAPFVYLLIGALGAAGVCLFLGRPVPRVTDELSYLLAAETFASGRVSNPTPPLAEHFELQHVLMHPSRMSKYPPAPAMVLAVGKLLGHPAVALWFQAGALAASIYWLVTSVLPRPWPGLGALLVALRLGVGSYWHQSYWGGGLAAIGGCLLLGALLRLWVDPRMRDGCLLALGVGILANSRYYEGLVFVLPCTAVLMWRLVRLRDVERRRFLLALLPALILLAMVGALMLVYNLEVTGDPWQLPHLAYTSQELEDFGHFLWTHPETREGWPLQAAAQLFVRTAYVLQFTLGLVLAVVTLLFLPRLRGSRAVIVALAAGVLLVGLALTRSWWQHYAAPATGAVVLLALWSLERLRSWRHDGHGAGAALAASLFLLSGLSAIIQVRAYRADADDWSYRRAEIDRELGDRGGRHLVLVRYEGRSSSAWVFNSSDLESMPVLWASELSVGQSVALRASHHDREAWLLVVRDGWSVARLLAWSEP